MRFGQRAKKIKNNAVVNVQYSAEELKIQVRVHNYCLHCFILIG